MNEHLSESALKHTSLCKCGKEARFIKDYFVTEQRVLKEGEGDNIVKRNIESACGIIRRRYCVECFSKIAAKQKILKSRWRR